MNLGQEIKIALKNIQNNKLRAFLTMLGIIIGVSAVIIMVALTEGAASDVTNQVKGLGTNLITVSIRNSGEESVSKRSLDYNEAKKMTEIPGIDIVSPIISGNVNVRNGNKSADISLEGVDSYYEKLENISMASGRFLLQIDLDQRYEVVVLGANVANELFGTADPVGESIKINGKSYDVVGVLAEKGSSIQGSVDDKVFIPLTSAGRLLNQDQIQLVKLSVKSEDQVEKAIVQVDQYLSRVFSGDDDNYNILNAQDMLETLNSVTSTFTLLSGGIASISLLVGGIGIMNIMLVSVTERTREIGIRKALGAKKKDILMQFLIESVVLSGIGGVIGLLTGIGGVTLLSGLLGLSNVISGTMVLLSVGFSVLVGVIFGIYPANKAAKLNPIDALRFE